MSDRTCLDCGKGISTQSKSGRCRRCGCIANNASPEFQARRTQAIRDRYKDPMARAKAAREIALRHLAARKDPEKAKVFSENLAKARARLNDPDVVAKVAAARAGAGRKRHETVMAWCPKEYRAEYRRLCLSKRMLAPQAKAHILDKVKRDREAMSPFERQMAALMRGAQLVEKVSIPSRSYERTLGGGSPL